MLVCGRVLLLLHTHLTNIFFCSKQFCVVFGILCDLPSCRVGVGVGSPVLNPFVADGGERSNDNNIKWAVGVLIKNSHTHTHTYDCVCVVCRYFMRGSRASGLVIENKYQWGACPNSGLVCYRGVFVRYAI